MVTQSQPLREKRASLIPLSLPSPQEHDYFAVTWWFGFVYYAFGQTTIALLLFTLAMLLHTIYRIPRPSL